MSMRATFNSCYLLTEIKQLSEKYRSNFSLFDADLSFENKKHICVCCLCRATEGKFNILNDPFCILNGSASFGCCFQNEIECDTNQLKTNSLCANCMQVVSFVSSKKDSLTKAYQCRFLSCEFKSQRSFNMKRHYLIHLNVKNNQCAICEEHFASKSGLQNHQRTCAKKRQFRRKIKEL